MGKRADKNRRKAAKLQKRERILDGMMRLGVDKETQNTLRGAKARVTAEIENLEHARGKHRRWCNCAVCQLVDACLMTRDGKLKETHR